MLTRRKIIFISIVIAFVMTLFGLILSLKINQYQNMINYIFVSKLPYITEYTTNQEFNSDGLLIEVVLNNGKKFIANNNELNISGFDSTEPDPNQEITVEYQGYKCSFNVNINELPKPAIVLVGIELETLPKTEYKVGEWLSTSGGILILKYNDGSSLKLSLINAYIYGYSNEVCNTPGIYTLTVKYVENGVLAETTFDITVTE